MRNPLRVPDDVLFDYGFQPLVNVLEPATTPKDAALFCLLGTIVADLARVLADYQQGQLSHELFGDALGIASCMVLYGLSSWLQIAGSVRNPLRAMPSHFILRLLMIASVTTGAFKIGDLRHVVSYAGTILFFSFLYLEACDKPPPRRRTFHGIDLARASA